jgi:hypothetical protein
MSGSFTTQVLKVSQGCYIDIKDMRECYNNGSRSLQNKVVTDVIALVFYV